VVETSVVSSAITLKQLAELHSEVKSCQLPIVRNTIDTVKDVSYAFHYSSKRTGRFKTMLQQADEE
jgi:hypothetical protein